MRKIGIRFLWVPLVLIATTAGAQQKGWESQWKEILAAAKKEGKVVVMRSADPAVRTKLPAAFKKRFGISLEYLGGRSHGGTQGETFNEGTFKVALSLTLDKMHRVSYRAQMRKIGRTGGHYELVSNPS